MTFSSVIVFLGQSSPWCCFNHQSPPSVSQFITHDGQVVRIFLFFVFWALFSKDSLSLQFIQCLIVSRYFHSQDFQGPWTADSWQFELIHLHGILLSSQLALDPFQRWPESLDSHASQSPSLSIVYSQYLNSTRIPSPIFTLLQAELLYLNWHRSS